MSRQRQQKFTEQTARFDSRTREAIGERKLAFIVLRSGPLAPLARVACIGGIASTLLFAPGCSWWRSMTGQTEVSDTQTSAPGTDLGSTSRPATTQITSEDVAPVPASLDLANRPVVQGPLPLIYLVETDGALRVRNVTTKEEIITFPVKAMQILRVESSGVMLANKPVIGANLAPGNYAIEVVPPDANSVRTRQKREGIPQSQ